MNSYREELKREFSDKEYRDAYAEDFLNTKIATQLRVIREQRELTETELVQKLGPNPLCVAELEDVNYTSWDITTLKTIASALDVRLSVSFETFGSLLDEDDSFSREWLERPDFEHDPVFEERGNSAHALAGSMSEYILAQGTGDNRVAFMGDWKAGKRGGVRRPIEQSEAPRAAATMLPQMPKQGQVA